MHQHWRKALSWDWCPVWPPNPRAPHRGAPTMLGADSIDSCTKIWVLLALDLAKQRELAAFGALTQGHRVPASKARVTKPACRFLQRRVHALLAQISQRVGRHILTD